jgi:hypothetical protein
MNVSSSEVYGISSASLLMYSPSFPSRLYIGDKGLIEAERACKHKNNAEGLFGQHAMDVFPIEEIVRAMTKVAEHPWD